jgi:hypothetical protein
MGPAPGLLGPIPGSSRCVAFLRANTRRVDRHVLPFRGITALSIEAGRSSVGPSLRRGIRSLAPADLLVRVIAQLLSLSVFCRWITCARTSSMLGLIRNARRNESSAEIGSLDCK